jgi:hypothetical protein
MNQRTHEVTLTRCAMTTQTREGKSGVARHQDHMMARSDVNFRERDATTDQDQLT